MLGIRPAPLPRSLPGAGRAKYFPPLVGDMESPCFPAGKRGRGDGDAVTTTFS